MLKHFSCDRQYISVNETSHYFTISNSSLSDCCHVCIYIYIYIYMYTRVYIYNICNFLTIFNEIKADHSAHSPEMTNKVKY